MEVNGMEDDGAAQQQKEAPRKEWRQKFSFWKRRRSPEKGDEFAMFS